VDALVNNFKNNVPLDKRDATSIQESVLQRADEFEDADRHSHNRK